MILIWSALQYRVWMQGLPTEDIWPDHVREGCDGEVSASFHFVFTFLLLVCNFLLLPVEAQLVMNSEKHFF